MALLRGLRRTAAVAGTAALVSKRVSERQAGRWASNGQSGAPQPAPQPVAPTPTPTPAPAPDMSVKLDQLKQLGELKAGGVISEAEFEQQKARILA